MLDLGYLRDNIETARERLAHRGFTLDVETFQQLDGERKNLIQEVERLRQRRNTASEDIARLVKEKVDVSEKRNEMKVVSQQIKDIEESLRVAEDKLFQFAATIPNLPDPDVPVGLTEEQNVEVRRIGEPPRFDFEPKAHWDICPPLGILDLERATKITGSRFPLLAGAGARLERALINFMLDIQTREHGYQEVAPPFMANSKSLFGTGQLPKFEEDLFKVRDTDYYLIPTSEVPLTNMHRDEILEAHDLPLYYTAYSACFRSEAGAAGRDTRGLVRVHQFNKVELIKFVHPGTSYDELESMLADAERVLQLLEIPYRVMSICMGDLGFTAARKYDLEFWAPGQDRWIEVSSCSNCTDFQARRASIRFRPQPKARPEYVHTLNGSGLAVGRTLVAVLENCQRSDGSVYVPGVLVPYMGGVDVIS